MNSPNVTTVPLPPAKGRSIGRIRADQALGLRPRGPDAASKLGKIQSPQMGRIHRPLRDVVSNMRRRSATANKRASSAHLDGTGSGFSDNLCENNLRLGLAILFHHAHVKIYTR